MRPRAGGMRVMDDGRPRPSSRDPITHSPIHCISCLLFSRNQLWFIYVFASAREQFENGPLQQADSVRKTVRTAATGPMNGESGLVCASRPMASVWVHSPLCIAC